MRTGRNTEIKAEATIFADLFRRGRFVIPWHQRMYDWSPEDVAILIEDIEAAIHSQHRCYFLGTILLVQLNNNEWEVNDGQQRMITISLICAALCKRFYENSFDPRREALALRMLFDLDDDGVWSMGKVDDYTPRIDPPSSYKTQFRQILRGHSFGTDTKLTKACSVIDSYFGTENIGGMWEKFFDFIRQKLEVACLTLPSHLDSNAVFETINCRGKSLDEFDLLRNFFYSCFNSNDQQQKRETVHGHLESIRDVLSPTSAQAKNPSKYMRCHLQCKFGFLHKDKYYREFKKIVTAQKNERSISRTPESDKVFEIIEDISKPANLQLFLNLISSNPNEEFLCAFEAHSSSVNSARNLRVFLWELRTYAVAQPVVFALLSQYVHESDSGKKRRIAKAINRNLRRLTSFILRTAFAAPKFEPSKIEKQFSDFSQKIMKSNGVSEKEFSSFLIDCDRSWFGVLEDSHFKQQITGSTLTGSAKIKKFMLGINRHNNPDANVINERHCSVEHILPKSDQYWRHWSGFDEVEPKDWTNKIGNLTIVSDSDNKPGDKFNQSFEKKRELFINSSIAINRKLSNYNNWTPEAIRRRQKELAEIAVKVWRFD